MQPSGGESSSSSRATGSSCSTPDGSVHEANRRFAEMLGYSPEEVHRFTSGTGMSSGPVKSHRDLCTRGRAGTRSRPGIVARMGRSWTWRSAAMESTMAAGDCSSACAGTSRSGKQAEQALREREARYRAVIETTPDGFYVTDHEGRFLEVNDAYLRISGYTIEELHGLRIQDVEAKESAEEAALHIARIRQTGSDRFESLHRASDGPVWPMEANVSYWSGGGLFFTFLRDITDRKLAEQKLLDRELQIRSLGDNLPDSAVYQYTRDPDGSPRFVYMSAGVEHISRRQGRGRDP